MENETIISVQNVSKDFRLPHKKVTTIKSLFTGAIKSRGHNTVEVQHALKGISFEVKKGEFFGVVGRNGSGKSTMLKMLAGIYQPTSGTVSVQGKLVPFIELGVGFNPELSGQENVYLNGALLGFSSSEVDTFYDEVVEFAELRTFMDQKLKNYSSGMQVRLAFSMAIRANADILLIDEVLAVGDADFQRKCYEYFKQLKKNKKTVVFVSHDMGAIREFCDRAALIENSRLKAVGDTMDITQQYSQLFMNERHDTTQQGNRWGNGDITITKVSTKLDNGNVLVDVDLKAIKRVDHMIYGIHIIGGDGAEVTAMNNRMVNLPDVENINKGDRVHLQWQMANIFNDGTYTVNLTFIDDTATTLDWYIDATSFNIKRAERSTTAVLPPVSAQIKISKGQGK